VIDHEPFTGTSIFTGLRFSISLEWPAHTVCLNSSVD